MFQNFLVFIYFIAFWKWWPKKKEYFHHLIRFSSYGLLKFSPLALGGDLSCEHSCFAHGPMQICEYLHEYFAWMHKNWFPPVLKVKESKSAVKIAEKQHFHGDNRGWKFCDKIFSSELWPQIASCWRKVASKFFSNFVALCLYFLLI